MPLKEFSNSVKAKLYDFTYTPFLSSMVIAWIVLNHKYILIYMSSLKLEKKLVLLEEYRFTLDTQWGNIPYAYNILLPILFGLFYTFVYPFFAKFFYKYTLNKSKILKEIKVSIEDITPITKEESTALKSENYSKTEKIMELEGKITEVRAEYDMRITTIADKTKKEVTEKLHNNHLKIVETMKNTHEDNMKKQKEQLKHDYDDAYQALVEINKKQSVNYDKINKIVTKLREENKALQEKVPFEYKEEENAERKVLRFFYEENYKTIRESAALDSIVEYTQLKRPKVQQIINHLIKENVLEKDSLEYLSITVSGNNYLVGLFDN